MDYYIDNYNFKGFGIYVQESTGVVDLPKFKPPTETDWAEYHGVIVDSEKTPRTEARTIQLKCFLKAENQVDFLTKLSAFQSVFMTKGLKRLAIILTNEVGLFFDVYMSDGLQVTKRWSDSTMVGQFTVTLIEPEPIKKIIRFDSQGSASTLSFKTSEAVSVYWGDGTYQHDLYGNVSLSHTYDEAGIYFAIIHGNIDNITDLNTNGDILTTNNGGNIDIELPEYLDDMLTNVELFNVAEPGISQITPYIRFSFNNNGETRYLRITITTNDNWLAQLTEVRNGLTQVGNRVTTIENKVGNPNGIAELDQNGKVPAAQLPGFVDDVIEYASLSQFPEVGESGKIYIAIDTNKSYRWSGTQYSVIVSDLALGETASSAYRGDRGKIAYDHSQINNGNPHNTQITDIPYLQDTLDTIPDELADLSGDSTHRTVTDEQISRWNAQGNVLKQVQDLDSYQGTLFEVVQNIGSSSNYHFGYIYVRDSVHHRILQVSENDFGVSAGQYNDTGEILENVECWRQQYVSQEDGYDSSNIVLYSPYWSVLQVNDYAWSPTANEYGKIILISVSGGHDAITINSQGGALGGVYLKKGASGFTGEWNIYKNSNDEIIYYNRYLNQIAKETRTSSWGDNYLILLPIGTQFSNLTVSDVTEFYWKQLNVQPYGSIVCTENKYYGAWQTLRRQDAQVDYWTGARPTDTRQGIFLRSYVEFRNIQGISSNSTIQGAVVAEGFGGNDNPNTNTKVIICVPWSETIDVIFDFRIVEVYLSFNISET